MTPFLYFTANLFANPIVSTLKKKKKKKPKDFPCGPVAKPLCSQCKGPGLIPGQGARSHMPQPKVCKLQLRPGAVK